MAKGKKKYRLKKSVGKYLALTSVNKVIIIKDEEVELDEEQYLLVKDFVEEVPVVTRRKSVKVSEESSFMEDD